jgi:acetyl-CoA synthetase/medium-chain acyl-CoA synthetase
MGRPVPGFDVDVVDDQGTRMDSGEEGSLAIRVEPVRPVGLMAGYWRDPDATAAAFHDGWYYTGDRGVRDEDGYLWFVARDDDVIISASYRIGPFEVESALVEHPAVLESAVVAKPDQQRTSIVKAFVVLAPGHEPSDALARELQAHVREVTAPYKYPREIEFVDELPKTISGKIRRTELRAREAQKLAPS